MYSDGGGGDASMFAGGGFMPSQSQPTTEYGGGGAGSRVCWKEFHLSNNAECVFCELELCCPGRCVFLRGREDLGTGRASFEMWNCVGTSELVTDFGVAKQNLRCLHCPSCAKTCFGPPFWLPVNSHIFAFCA